MSSGNIGYLYLAVIIMTTVRLWEAKTNVMHLQTIFCKTWSCQSVNLYG